MPSSQRQAARHDSRAKGAPRETIEEMALGLDHVVLTLTQPPRKVMWSRSTGESGRMKRIAALLLVLALTAVSAAALRAWQGSGRPGLHSVQLGQSGRAGWLSGPHWKTGWRRAQRAV